MTVQTVHHTVVAGVGNIFLGDDAFGVEVARRLAAEQLPEGVLVADYGIRGMHLAYDLLAMQPETTILVDATPRGGEAGTLYLLEIEPHHVDDIEPVAVDSHGMQPEAVLGLLRTLGGHPGRVLLVGCEPVAVDEQMGLSPTVAAAVDEAVGMVRNLLNDGDKTSEAERSDSCASTHNATDPGRIGDRGDAGPQGRGPLPRNRPDVIISTPEDGEPSCASAFQVK